MNPSTATVLSPVAPPILLGPGTVIRQFKLASDHAVRLDHLAQERRLGEDELVEKALDLLFTLANLFDETLERRAWHRLSEPALYRLWDNEQDAVYDNWREFYRTPQHARRGRSGTPLASRLRTDNLGLIRRSDRG